HQKKLKHLLSLKKSVNAKQIILGNGSNEIIDLLIRTYCEPQKDHIITMPPTFEMYDKIAAINDVENKKVWLTEYFQPDITTILNNCTVNSKLLFVCTPNNPTGNAIEKAYLLELLENFKGL